jgi:hypothetical protein
LVRDPADYHLYEDRPITAVVNSDVDARDIERSHHGGLWVWLGRGLAIRPHSHPPRWTVPGFRADYERFPDEKLTVIILANADNESVEPLAIKLAGVYEPSLTIPPFTLTAGVPTQPVQKGEPVSFTINARDDGHAAPGTLLEIEIWYVAKTALGITLDKQPCWG